MKYFSKIRLAWTFVILLSAVNITVFVIYFTGFHHRHDGHHRRHGDREGCRERQECLLRSELNLDERQTIGYDRIRKDHHEKARPIVDSLRTIRSVLMLELKKENLDSSRVTSLVLQVNDFNNRLFGLSIEQYLQTKRILNPEQKERLSKIYCDMFGGTFHRNHQGPQNEGKPSCGRPRKCE